MHDHRIDGMLQFDHQGVTARALRLHLDNSHNAQTRGWDFDAQGQLHHKLHAGQALGLAGIAAAVSDESRPVGKSIYLSDANGTVYLVEPAGAWDGPLDGQRSAVYYEDEERPASAIPLYRLTECPPEVQQHASLARKRIAAGRSGR